MAPFNFLLGGIYVDLKVDRRRLLRQFASAIDYIAGMLGFASTYVTGGAPSLHRASVFRNNTAQFDLKSYGIFGEGYIDVSDRLKLTLGLRYNNDKKSVVSRSSLFNFLVPYTATTQSVRHARPLRSFDADPGTAGAQPYAPAERIVRRNHRARGARFQGHAEQPALRLVFARLQVGRLQSAAFRYPGLPSRPTFAPELIDAFEIGSKNTFANGALHAQRSPLLLQVQAASSSAASSRAPRSTTTSMPISTVSRSRAWCGPIPTVAINMGFSYLHTKVASDTPFINQRDPSGGNPEHRHHQGSAGLQLRGARTQRRGGAGLREHGQLAA